MNYEYYNPRKAALDAARELLTGAAKSAMSAGTLPEAELPDFIVEIPGDVKNGDIASNLAMAGARAFHRAPRQIAQAIVDRLDLTGSPFDRVEIAGPGFINLFLGQAWFTDVLRAACKGQGEPLREVCRVFNERTDEGRDMALYSRLLNAAIQSLVESKEESDLDSLFSGGRTSALVDTISGLNDFELLAFLVVI